MTNEKRQIIHLLLIVIGGFIMFIIAMVAIIDSQATDIVSSIPVSIFGAALFVSGYICYNNDK